MLVFLNCYVKYDVDPCLIGIPNEFQGFLQIILKLPLCLIKMCTAERVSWEFLPNYPLQRIDVHLCRTKEDRDREEKLVATRPHSSCGEEPNGDS